MKFLTTHNFQNILCIGIQNSMFPDVEIRGENLICGLSNEKRTHQHFKAYYYSLESRKNMLFECTNCNYVNSSL